MAGFLSALAGGLATGDGGRLRPKNWVAAQGDYAVCFGHDAPGRFDFVANGSRVRLSQSGDFDDVKILRFRSRQRGPRVALPAGYAWRFEVAIDGTPYISVDLEAGRDRERSDHAINVSHLAPGVHALQLQLTLVGPADRIEVEIPAVFVDALVFDNLTP